MPRLGSLTVAAAALVAGALTGCTTSRTGPHAVSAVSPLAAAPPAVSLPVTSPSVSAPPSPSASTIIYNSPESVPPAPPADSTADLAYFQTPSGNIRCALASMGAGGFNFARCDIDRWQWKLPPKPADCPFDWAGAVIVMDTGVGAEACHSDSVPFTHVLGYGQSMRRGPFACTSEQSGVTCKNDNTGHGFTLSRESFRGF
jgi:hypothetical protein